MILHLIYSTALTEAQIQRIGNNDVLVLLDGAVVHTLAHSQGAKKLTKLPSTVRCYVLQEHLTIYGLPHTALLPTIKVIDYSGLVALTVDCPTTYTCA